MAPFAFTLRPVGAKINDNNEVGTDKLAKSGQLTRDITAGLRERSARHMPAVTIVDDAVA